MKRIMATAIFCVTAARVGANDDLPQPGAVLTDEQVSAFAGLALAGLDREYPNKPSKVLIDAGWVKPTKELHPAFFGCYDWHSSLHGHWMLVRLIKHHPGCSISREVRRRLDAHLTLQNIRTEAAYFEPKENRSFERMYGWAWTLRMAAELHDWEDEDGKRWRENFRPLEQKIVELTKGYLPRLSHPIRTGVHPDTAFALSQCLDYARTVGDPTLEQLILRRSRDFYLSDRDYPAQYEPSGEDFFSAGLNEADLMRRVLADREFSPWLDQFFPSLRDKRLGELLTPETVTDVTDGKLVHLAGLNLSRAWTLRGIAAVLNEDDERKAILEQAADDHVRAGYRYVFSGHYEGEHWLATFAIYVQTRVGLDN